MPDLYELLDRRQSICPRCGDVVDSDQMVKKSIDKRPPGIELTVMVCSDCAGDSDCSTGTGIHGEVYDLDDMEERGMLTQIEQVPASLRSMRPSQVGVCSICGEWFVWSVPKQQWRDAEPDYFPEPYLDLDA